MNMQPLGSSLYAFFEDHLKCQKGLRPTSVWSYRDALRLYLQFVSKDAQRKITRLRLKDLTSDRVLLFLEFLEQDRGNHVRTRNQRLAALRTFFEYLADHVPEMLGEAQRVAAIPNKRVSPPEIQWLDRDEIKILFEDLPSDGLLALRDHALLLFLYNTGARLQEVVELRVANLELGHQPRVHLHGKGDKWRVCPLWAQTASLVNQLLQSQASASENSVFVSRHGRPLTRSGIYKIVLRHTHRFVRQSADGKPRRITPHTFRHTTAVHLLESGVEINVIRAWLGHVSLETTNRYAEVTYQMKEKALQTCEPPVDVSGTFPRRPVWQDDPSLLKWLQSL